ncbi:MAG: hypothetical protein U5K99_01400 [Anaerolineales bacterium]|nr:hypothetical protein [Anaerolineales bacterium]
MKNTQFSPETEQELTMARRSRREGNEGRARVCARRAAGFAVQRHLQKKGILPKEVNAYQALLHYREQPELAAEVSEALGWLTARVDHDYQLPEGVDLIQEAEVVITSVGDQPEDTEADG